MPTKVLITGITGMAGSHLADLLLSEQPDCHIYGTHRRRSPLDNLLHIKDRLNLSICDLTDATAVLELVESVRPEYIFHLAAHSFVQDSWRYPDVTINENIKMQLNI